jgi:bisphosphoglycerate-dependent phosphoglycerate mutase
MRLVLVRHGATVAAEGTCIGWTDVPFSRDGARAVESVAKRWDVGCVAPPERVLSSDLQRAMFERPIDHARATIRDVSDHATTLIAANVTSLDSTMPNAWSHAHHRGNHNHSEEAK